MIPGDVHRKLGLTQGSLLRVVVDGDGVRLFAADGDIRKLKGRRPAPASPVSVEDMNDAIAERRAKAGRG